MAKPIKKTNQAMDSKASMPLGYETVLQEVKSLRPLPNPLKAQKAPDLRKILQESFRL